MRKGSSSFWLVRALASAPPVVVDTSDANSWGSAGGALVRHLHALVHVLAVQVPQQLGVRCGEACVVGVGPWSVVCGCKVGAACTGAGGFDFRERRELARGQTHRDECVVLCVRAASLTGRHGSRKSMRKSRTRA